MLEWLAQTGLVGSLRQLGQFLAEIRWARSELLLLWLLVPLLILWQHRRQRQAAALVQQLPLTWSPSSARQRRYWPMSMGTAVLYGLLIIALAGPRWGSDPQGAVAVGRDLVVVLDLSRSMQADDMADPHSRSRWQAARQATLDLLATVQQRGGHRVALIIFAARPLLLAPLTTDYDFLRTLLQDLDGEYPPVEIRPAPTDTISGTRIGRALQAAVAAHDARFPGYQDILLLSDGDDPADDDEWQQGVHAALQAAIPVHTCGLGDPQRPATLILGEAFVQTRLEESVLQRIAEQTGGYYLPAQRQLPQLGAFFRDYLEPLPQRVTSDEALPVPQERYLWALLPACLVYLLVWLWHR